MKKVIGDISDAYIKFRDGLFLKHIHCLKFGSEKLESLTTHFGIPLMSNFKDLPSLLGTLACVYESGSIDHHRK